MRAPHTPIPRLVAAALVLLFLRRCCASPDPPGGVFLSPPNSAPTGASGLATRGLFLQHVPGAPAAGTNRAAAPPRPWPRDIDPSFSNVVNSVFPVDMVVSYNASGGRAGGQMVARYAAFSPVLRGELRGHYVFVAGSACSEIAAHQHPEYTDKILVVARGKCTFVQKLENIRGARLAPRAVVVANNVPHGGLITMYSRSFNRDEQLRFPVLFLGFEDAETLRAMQPARPELALRTAPFDGFLGLVLLMAVLPPLVIVACYAVVRASQWWARRRRNARNRRYVRLLPVYIYARTHLVPWPAFYEYLLATGQTDDIPLALSSVADVAGPPACGALAAPPFVAGGTDLLLMPDLHILYAAADFYPTQKCAICLGRFVPLKLRVLVLACKHVHHEDCLANWLINFRRTCPLCNEAVRAHDAQQLLTHGGHGYGTFAADPENPTPATDDAPGPAARSLRVDLARSGLDDSEGPRPSCSGQALASRADRVLPIARVPLSDSSFVTTKTHQSGDAPSSYHTSAGVFPPDSGDDTQLDESGHSTLRF
ncbi:hypothetical protein METBIDRAFT_12037 [Metschnikowia bicuspidata var. bicuspidata NRRL YB-4993]|uniref:RING-type domain-containing protein n=1 Tax=Metschnikowia bicuspidata var. bicuspidata NRRL YB-4993 TaxID=869754 RepID=A0A1A0HCD3_9ASCO|nr:hypothetical protein METBIDRAFT_12037 [Metschnikowia bicuspidata var. bicuspidata NRRL YB-4993]OBA21542.1 hypothetical protein METBIDRAFT_12037 [Metschnikowia bicuspidata var. bicuspidata NRRL YB-4993]